MKNNLLLLLLLIIPLFSFIVNSKKTENINAFTGKYGGCTKCPNSVQLLINEDSTFQYINKSNPVKPIDVKGNWEINNNTILLKNYKKSAAPIPKKWKIDKNYPCLRSVTAPLEFIRICKDN